LTPTPESQISGHDILPQSQDFPPQKTSGQEKRGVSSHRRGLGGKRRAEGEHDEERKSEVPDPVPSRRPRPMRHSSAANHSGYRRMMEAPADEGWDMSGMNGDNDNMNAQLNNKNKLEGYNSHTAAGESLRNDMHQKYGLMENSTAERGIEFDELNDWATVSARNVADRVKKYPDSSRAKRGTDFAPNGTLEDRHNDG
jgi:hypothetical protein